MLKERLSHIMIKNFVTDQEVEDQNHLLGVMMMILYDYYAFFHDIFFLNNILKL